MDKQKIETYQLFSNFENLLAFSTTRSTFSNNALPRFTGEPAGKVKQNRVYLAAVLKIRSGQLVFPRQTHTSCVADLDRVPENEINETDALVTNQPGICLCVQTADCVPVLLFDPVNRTIAAVHAGWRGTVKKIAEAVVLKMQKKYHSNSENILAAIGPSIGPEVYEVGSEVVEEVRKNLPLPDKILQKNKSGKFHFNLWEANRQILLAAGLKEGNIRVSEECTFQKENKYYSARREGIETGRIVSGIMLV
ncbi:MAG: peptidoglycan editing factor PgeF [Tangfeifania sp.]